LVDKNPSLASHYQQLFEQTQGELQGVLKAFSSHQHPDSRVCIDFPWLLRQAREKMDVYYPYTPPILYQLDSRDREKGDLPEISFSAFDYVESIGEELKFKLALPLYNALSLYNGEHELQPYSKLLNYDNEGTDAIIEFCFSPLCHFSGKILWRGDYARK
jgi:hypothetical protein